MAGKKDNALVVVVSDLTEEQACGLSKAVMKEKRRIAPYGRGTIAFGKKSEVGNLIQQGKRTRLKEV